MKCWITKSVKLTFSCNNIEYETFDDQVVFAPGTIKTGENKPYSVFTPFKRRWIENFNLDLLDIEYDYPIKNNTEVFSNVENFDFDYKKSHSVDMSLWKIGEQNVLSILMNYLDENIYRYSTDRNDPIIDGTSRLSPYLSMGIISSKRCILESLKKNNFEIDSGEKGITKWIDEIVWREFYRNIMFSFPKVSKGMPFQDYTKNIKWRFNEEEFDSYMQEQKERSKNLSQIKTGEWEILVEDDVEEFVGYNTNEVEVTITKFRNVESQTSDNASLEM